MALPIDRHARFETTRWSLVQALSQSEVSTARDALAILCQIYWYPLYAYVRRQGHPVEDAQDLTQAFFVQLLERNDLAIPEVILKTEDFRPAITNVAHHTVNSHGRKLLGKGGDNRLRAIITSATDQL